MPQPATDDPGQPRGSDAHRTPRLWLVRGGGAESDVAAAARPQAAPSGNDNGDLDAAVAERLPSAKVEQIHEAGDRGAARIFELSKELADRAADVVRCRAEVIVARRIEELARLRRGVSEDPARIEAGVRRLRAGVHELAAQLRHGE